MKPLYQLHDELEQATHGPLPGQSAADWQAELERLQAEYQAAHEAVYGFRDENAEGVTKHIKDYPFGFDA